MPSFWSWVSKQPPNSFSSTSTAFVDGEADAVVDGLLAVAHGDGSVLGDLAGQLQGVLHQLSLRIHGVDQANAQASSALMFRAE